MTRKVTIQVDSLVIFLKATHNDLLTMNVALGCGNEKIITDAIKVNRHRIERIRAVLIALDMGETLIDVAGVFEDGEGK